MKKRTISSLGAAALLAMSMVSQPSASADTACGSFSSGLGQCINSQLTVAGTSYNVDWYLPHATASALMLMEHGFSRGCGNLRDTAKATMEKGVMVLCLNADMSGGNPGLGQALGDLLTARTFSPPAGKSLPANYIVGGHSAGGHFASVVGARIANNGYANLKGAVLFDPVAQGGFSANLDAISAGGTRPVLSVAARPSVINLTNNSFGALTGLANTFVGIQLVWSGYFFGIPYGGSCHTDVEGNNGDIIGNTAALCTPNSTQTSRLRDFSSSWAKDLATGTHTAAYYCDNSTGKVNCGSKVTGLVNGFFAQASLIRTS